ncbi:MAG: DegV family protein [Anaerolineales bacterium]|nr:MAG: DegV family protein [Anaerolineales bacterium]
MPTVRIVTDSTSDISPGVVARLGITVVPAYIQVGGNSYQDGAGLRREELYARMSEMEDPPTTSVPPAQGFASAYRDLAREADEIVAIVVSSTLSGMQNVAELGASEVPDVKVHVIDSLQVSMGIGWMVIAAAKAAAEGRTAQEIVQVVEDLKARVHTYAALDTVHFLRLGGRTTWPRARAADMLGIKPVLEVFRGKVTLVHQARTRKQAIDRLVEIVGEAGQPERLAIIHTLAPEVHEFRERLAIHCPREDLFTAVATTIIGAHVGPRALGVALVSNQ